ncbi:ribonuclease E activity regulator RraA [Rhodococcoides kyotonense]|uniref:4-hydroxy-4-methyl-2-oxoglutarate aldolase n=1 Tax=Rhodococcoides kyotonense TaxID=398843 RepID=A0A239N265_9NOCA|nr:ribonuclease E activity regulator RraA [Rhodococcus kyotonensis]SNT48514.1 regulator of ribonuclease activity A [Rhodococcus kyotonensis]
MSSVDFSTCDICDAHDDVRILDPLTLRDFGGTSVFAGPALTVKVFEDNAPIRELVVTPGEGRVLAVDGAGSVRASLLGGNIAKRAADNGWAGLVVYGCVRDAAELASTPVGLRALGLVPRKTERNLHSGRTGGTIDILGTSITDGDWIYADADGIVITEKPVHNN